MTTIRCTTSTASAEIESTLKAGSSGLTYDATGDKYTYATPYRPGPAVPQPKAD